MSVMRRLTLVRHAKSSWRFRHLDDFHRPLNRRGLRDCARMPRLVARRLASPELVLCSDAVRSVQTCQALADAFEIDEDRIVLDSELYLADLDPLVKRVRNVSDGLGHVMMIGHNPGLTDLANYLLPAPIADLPTLALAVLDLTAGSWSEASRGTAALRELMLPRELLKERS